jgi:hypothetical protein
MEAVILALAIGAGSVYAVKNGRKALRRAVGWTAEKTGFITGRVQQTLAETRRLARERYEAGREADRERTELAPPSPRALDDAEAARVPGTGASSSPAGVNGTNRPATGGP